MRAKLAFNTARPPPRFSPRRAAARNRPADSAILGVDRVLAAYLLLTALALALPRRPEGWAALLALHLVAAGALLHLSPTHEVPRLVGKRFAAARELLGVWYPAVLIPLLYSEIPLLNGAVHGGRYFDAAVIRWERALFAGMPSQSWAGAAPWLWISEPLHAAYLAYYPLMLVPLLVLQWQRRPHALRTAFLVIAFVGTIHYLTYVFVPVQGPRYLFAPPSAGGIDRGAMYRLTHRVLEAGSSRGAAFPSSHVGMSVAQTVVCIRFLPRLAPWVGLLTVALAVATVYGGFHYLIDSLAGAALGVGGALLALRLGGRSSSASREAETCCRGVPEAD